MRHTIEEYNEKSYQYELIALSTNKEPTFKEKWYKDIISEFLVIFNVIFRMACCHDNRYQQQAFNSNFQNPYKIRVLLMPLS